MSESDTIELKDRGLKKLVEAFKGRLPVARVGILGGDNKRTEEGSTNAEVGAAHEFGTSKLPRRSFLRMPITDKLNKALDANNAFDETVLKEVLRTGSAREWMMKVGETARDIVLGAFATGGFGQWKPSNMKHKDNHQTLVETTQLRESITYDVK